MAKANAAKKSTASRANSAPAQEQQQQPAGLHGAFNQFVHIAKPVASSTLPALKKFAPLLVAADPPVAAVVLGVIFAGSVLGHGARYLARQRANRKPTPTPAP